MEQDFIPMHSIIYTAAANLIANDSIETIRRDMTERFIGRIITPETINEINDYIHRIGIYSYSMDGNTINITLNQTDTYGNAYQQNNTIYYNFTFDLNKYSKDVSLQPLEDLDYITYEEDGSWDTN